MNKKHDKQKILPVHKENNIPKHCHTDDYYNLNYSFSLLPLFTPLFIKDMSQKSVQAENSPQQYKKRILRRQLLYLSLNLLLCYNGLWCKL